LFSFVALAGFAFRKRSVVVLAFTKDEAYAAVAEYTASVWPSNLTETSITAAEASINNTN
jgi:hypothetical protein